MAEPFVVNRFFETPLLTLRIPDNLAAALRGEIAPGAAEVLDRTIGSVAALADVALELATRFTRDIGQTTGARYRWEWDARMSNGQARPGAFWSLLFPVGEGTARLRLHDPRLPWIAIEEPALRYRDGVHGELWHHDHVMELEPGQAAMVTGWLLHTLGGAPAVRIDLWALLAPERAG